MKAKVYTPSLSPSLLPMFTCGCVIYVGTCGCAYVFVFCFLNVPSSLIFQQADFIKNCEGEGKEEILKVVKGVLVNHVAVRLCVCV